MSCTQALAVVTLTSMVLTIGAGPSTAATGQPGGVPAMNVARQRVVHIPDSELLALSPDGGLIAVSRPAGPAPTDLCIHDVATLEELLCADLGDLDARLWSDSVVWSPDSSQLAFAERWPQYFVDGDLWLLDASTGDLTNLLDDGYRGALGTADANEGIGEGIITLPSYPTFSADGSAVTFSRSVFRDGEIQGVDVATIPLSGGEAARVGDLGHEEPGFDYWRKQWTADGSRLYVSLVQYQPSGLGPNSGLWVHEADGGGSRQLLSVTGPDDWPPRILAVSPGGERLLVLYPQYRSEDGMAPAYALVDGETGAVEHVEPLRPDDRRSTPITGAMLSPDGTALMTVSGRRGRQVAVRAVGGSDEAVLLTEPAASVPSDLAGEVLAWTRNGSVLVNGGRSGRGTLLVLDTDEGTP